MAQLSLLYTLDTLLNAVSTGSTFDAASI